MVANPMQKMKRTSTLVGVVIGLMVGLILCGAMYVVFIQPTMGTGITNKGEMVDVAILNKAIKSGAEITAADITQSKVNSQNAPTDATLNVIGSVAKIDETPRTIRILKKFEPTTLATLISFWPAKEDVILTAASGAEVPMATIVSPIIIDGTLNFLAIEAVPSTKKSAPFISKIKPIIKKI